MDSNKYPSVFGVLKAEIRCEKSTIGLLLVITGIGILLITMPSLASFFLAAFNWWGVLEQSQYDVIVIG
jgi:hypothetical protein